MTRIALIRIVTGYRYFGIVTGVGMREFTIRNHLGEEVECISLDYEEECELARCVMNMLGAHKVLNTPEFYELCDRLFNAKAAKGLPITKDEINEFLYYYIEVWEEEIPDLAYNDDTRRMDGTNEERQRHRIRAWREVWKTHPSIRRVSDRYAVFPGDDRLQEYDRPSREQVKEFIREQDARLEARIQEVMHWEEAPGGRRPSRREAFLCAKEEVGGTGEDLARVEFPWYFEADRVWSSEPQWIEHRVDPEAYDDSEEG